MCTLYQGWEFAHRFSERIACFLRKKGANERFAQKKRVIRSFLVSSLSDLLTSHFFGERPERFAHVAH